MRVCWNGSDCLKLLLSAQHSADLQGVIEDRGRPVKHRSSGRKSSCCPPSAFAGAGDCQAGSASVGRWCGVGSRASPRKALRVCCATKPVQPGIPPVPQAKVHAVVERTLQRTARCSHPLDRPRHGQGDGSFRCERSSAYGLPISSQPHRIRTFKRSNDPDFAAKLDDVVGLYMNPPRHAVVVSIDEKSQIQALDSGPSRVFR